VQDEQADTGPPQPAAAGASSGSIAMIYTIALVLFLLWVLGLVTSFTAGGLLHILLVVAVVMIIYQLVTGRRVG
jgi:uncharacterized membrane protein YtjA (UPF0391 family)